MKPRNKPIVVSWGGGVNSSAMLVGMRERQQRPDLILFADTEAEKPETYAFKAIMHEWTLDYFGIGITTVRAAKITDANLEANCLRLGTLPSIVFGYRSCSQRWKAEPQEKFLNSWKPAKDGFIRAIGIDAGERHRAAEYPDTVYPLIEWGWDRDKCVAALNRVGLPIPIKSACFFCPSSRKSEVLALAKEHPDLFARAVRMEMNKRGDIGVRGLGRNWSWEELVANDGRQFRMFADPEQIPCMCFDGEVAQ